MKHTPGPWRAVEDYVWSDAGLVTVVKRIVREDTKAADARLIAAAPELLSALEEVVADLDAYVEKFGGRCDSIEKARSLISRLRSEEE